ncbi:hypothetical protein OX284_008560 [Flavobacterium sp. SUN046]|uniref:hypothetical protein n=1 Tax=Flavobacterium sp. SUN046 TaxID=3002440 RepID=UPI002DB85278|nr:hypothetical protein [Flavobacterium sp. SUN046]MEC4049479.1 hypothetical protein [Flavobacterium sp. SUN046]
MNTTSTNKKVTLSHSKLFMMVVLFLLSCTAMNAQTVSNDEAVKVETTTSITNSIAATDSQIDFVGWFMGSNQNQSINEGGLYNDKNSSTKKQIISSGIIPNRVLYKTLVKKIFVDAVV